MRIFAASLEAPTRAFLAALDALRSCRHEVDLWRERSFAESVQGYNLALVGVGDFTSEDAKRTKLAIAKAAIHMPVLYFLDRPTEGMDQEPEHFWKDAIFREGSMGALHRAEMLSAMRSDLKPKIDALLESWRRQNFVGITPTFRPDGVMDWNPTPWMPFRGSNTRKDTPLTITKDDDLDPGLVARAFCVQRDRPEMNGWRPLWSPLAVTCARNRTLYADPAFNDLYYGEPADHAWPSTDERNRLVERQAAEFLTNKSEETSAAELNEMVLGFMRGPR
jgi:hypothetical protein